MGGYVRFGGQNLWISHQEAPCKGAFYYNEVAVGAGYFVYVSRVILGM